MQKGVDVDTNKEILVYADGRDPVPVVKCYDWQTERP